MSCDAVRWHVADIAATRVVVRSCHGFHIQFPFIVGLGCEFARLHLHLAMLVVTAASVVTRPCCCCQHGPAGSVCEAT